MELVRSAVNGYGNSITIAPEQFQLQPDGQHSTTTVTWLQCSSRVVTAELPEDLSSAHPLDPHRCDACVMTRKSSVNTCVYATCDTHGVVVFAFAREHYFSAVLCLQVKAVSYSVVSRTCLSQH